MHRWSPPQRVCLLEQPREQCERVGLGRPFLFNGVFISRLFARGNFGGMKFNLRTSGVFYQNSDTVSRLEKLGFEFEPSDYKEFIITDKRPEIEFSSLEELVSFANEHGEIIVMGDTIEIYDDYRE